MENNNQSPSSSPPPPLPPHSSSSSSLTTQLFGDNDSQPPSTGIFSAIFRSPSTVARNSSRLQFTHPMHYETLGSLGISAENVAKNTANGNTGVINMERRSIFQERIEPCPLSSSIYYGGQEDMYIRSSSDLTSKPYTKTIQKTSLICKVLPEETGGKDRSTINMSRLTLMEIHGDMVAV